jgi:putative phage-type endonuclease
MISSEPVEQLQRTDQWQLDRLGKVTASRISDVVSKTKSGSYLAPREAYKWQLVRERITGVPSEFRVNAAMQWGIDNEDDARVFYETLYDVSVEQVGFIDHPWIAMSGASPDGLVGDEGLLEVKCMESVNHLKAIFNRQMPDYYVDQCYWQMAVTGRQWCDLTIYDPRVPDSLQLRRFRLNRDAKRIEELEYEVQIFNSEIDKIVSHILEQ